MKVKLSGVRIIFIKGEHIKLDSLLKFASVASTGGEAKYLIQSGEVFVDGILSVQRGKKIKSGSVVRCGSDVLLIKNETEKNADRLQANNRAGKDI